jgi:sugar/nucleoside kinase (ribokinase family)
VIYSLTDYLFINETEAQTLSGLNFKTSDLTAVEQVAD